MQSLRVIFDIVHIEQFQSSVFSNIFTLNVFKFIIKLNQIVRDEVEFSKGEAIIFCTKENGIFGAQNMNKTENNYFLYDTK